MSVDGTMTPSHRPAYLTGFRFEGGELPWSELDSAQGEKYRGAWCVVHRRLPVGYTA
jgi:hypothetical protein